MNGFCGIININLIVHKIEIKVPKKYWEENYPRLYSPRYETFLLSDMISICGNEMEISRNKGDGF